MSKKEMESKIISGMEALAEKAGMAGKLAAEESLVLSEIARVSEDLMKLFQMLGEERCGKKS